MANFCGKCGTPLDSETGLCPVCDAKPSEPEINVAIPVAPKVQIVEEKPEEQPAVSNEPQNTEKPKEPQKAETPKKAKKKKPAAVTVIITVLLSILLFITTIASVTIYNVREIIKEDHIEDIVDELKVAKMFGEGRLDKFYSYLWSDYQMHVTDRSLENFIEDSSIKEMIVEKVADFGDDIFEDGSAKIRVKVEEVAEVLYDESNLIEKHFGARLSYSEIYEIADWMIKDDQMVLISTNTLEIDVPWVYFTLRVVLTYIMLAVFIVLSILFIIIMIKNSLSQAAVGTGIVFVLIGAPILLSWPFGAAVSSAFKAMIPSSIVGPVVGAAMAKLVSICAGIGAILFVVGIGLFLLNHFVIKRFVKKNKGEQ